MGWREIGLQGILAIAALSSSVASPPTVSPPTATTPGATGVLPASHDAATVILPLPVNHDPQPRRVPLDAIGQSLLDYQRTRGRPPRLALVLSGGGAKCAYQVGAVTALEEDLARLRREHPGQRLDIDLVIGTSGGAVNALPVALGVTADAAGQADLGQVWRALDQRDLLRPSTLVRALCGMWLMAVQAGLVLLLIGRRYPAGSRRRRDARSLAFVALGAVQLALAYSPWMPWELLGRNHLLHHLLLLGSIGARWTAWCLLLLGACGLLVGLYRDDTGTRFVSAGRWTRRGIWGAAVLLPLAVAAVVLLHEPTLSGDEGIERAMADNYRYLVDRLLERAGHPPLLIEAHADSAARLRDLSRAIHARGLLRRDLVLTGACLPGAAHGLPGDLYFYADAASQSEPIPFDERGLPLASRPELLLDVVMGSGSVYPAFPPRRLPDLPAAGQSVDLVDGSFSHRSPVEAAVLWGATHVVLIEAWPTEYPGQGNLLANTAAALCHLYDQAQAIDERSKDQAVIFKLSPEPPFMCMFDFAETLIDDAIAKGYREARGGHILSAAASDVAHAGGHDTASSTAQPPVAAARP
jgi:predicted acylesterase/phospholipase RssA